MTVYYTHSNGSPSAQSRGTSSTMRAEFDAIAAGFALVTNDVATIAASSGVSLSSTAEVTLASAANGVTVLGTIAGNIVSITGTNNISSFGTTYTNSKFIRFTGALTIVASSTLVTPSGQNITTQAGDCCIATPIGNPATGWRIEDYTRMGLPMLSDDALRKSVTVTVAQGGTGAITAAGALASLGAAASGANNDITALGALTSAGSSSGMNLPYVTSINGGQLAGTRNVLINGDFRVAQRGTSFSTTTDSNPTPGYTLDRWYVYHNNTIGSAGTVTQSTGPTNVAGFPYGNVLVITGSTNTLVTHVSQRIEAANCKHLIGQTVTLSYWVWCNANAGTIIPRLGYNTGSTDVFSLGTVTDITGTGNTTIANATWTKITRTFTVPAAAVNGLVVDLAGVGLLTGSIIMFGAVQLEVGSVATQFESRSYGLELALCQRYYYATPIATSASQTLGVAINYNASNGTAYIPFPVIMRAPATAMLALGTFSVLVPGSGSYAASALTLNTGGISGATIAYIGGSMAVASGWLVSGAAVATIGFSGAEL